MSNIVFTQYDSGINMLTNFVNNKQKYDLTNKNVKLVIVSPNNEKLERECIINDAINGQAIYVITKSDTSEHGLYKMYFSVYDDNNNITATNIITYYVVKQHGGV